MKKLFTEEDLIKAFSEKVLDDVLEKSSAPNKPDFDLSLENTILLASAIEASEEQDHELSDLTPEDENKTIHPLPVKSNRSRPQPHPPNLLMTLA